VTDWEFAHLGDPAEDWSFCLAMPGSRTLPRATWLALFEEVGGFRMDEDGWTYWEAFNLFKGACANCTCLSLFERGSTRAEHGHHRHGAPPLFFLRPPRPRWCRRDDRS
jgi:aminoglycoside phosphotransferase (APT) family kinase protein